MESTGGGTLTVALPKELLVFPSIQWYTTIVSMKISLDLGFLFFLLNGIIFNIHLNKKLRNRYNVENISSTHHVQFSDSHTLVLHPSLPIGSVRRFLKAKRRTRVYVVWQFYVWNLCLRPHDEHRWGPLLRPTKGSARDSPVLSHDPEG